MKNKDFANHGWIEGFAICRKTEEFTIYAGIEKLAIYDKHIMFGHLRQHKVLTPCIRTEIFAIPERTAVPATANESAKTTVGFPRKMKKIIAAHIQVPPRACHLNSLPMTQESQLPVSHKIKMNSIFLFSK